MSIWNIKSIEHCLLITKGFERGCPNGTKEGGQKDKRKRTERETGHDRKMFLLSKWNIYFVVGKGFWGDPTWLKDRAFKEVPHGNACTIEIPPFLDLHTKYFNFIATQSGVRVVVYTPTYNNTLLITYHPNSMLGFWKA